MCALPERSPTGRRNFHDATHDIYRRKRPATQTAALAGGSKHRVWCALKARSKILGAAHWVGAKSAAPREALFSYNDNMLADRGENVFGARRFHGILEDKLGCYDRALWDCIVFCSRARKQAVATSIGFRRRVGPRPAAETVDFPIPHARNSHPWPNRV